MTISLDAVVLKQGSHHTPADGMCVMEAVAYVAREPFGDHPACASSAIGSFLRDWNDNLNDDDRQMLKPYVPLIVGTNTGAKDDETRAWLATDWLVRECAPAFLQAVGLTDHAVLLENLAALTGPQEAADSQTIIDAARDAARDAAGDAAWDAAWDAARAAAGDAVRAAAGDAAWAAARAAAGDAARAAARDAARDTAGDTARDAARDTAGDTAWDAAWKAAWDALAPTVETMQRSALSLLDRMIAVGKES